jgi:leucyl/phenylalanyl-tRNA--protein transferase
MIPLLHRDQPFPPVDQALDKPNGLLCATLEVTAGHLLAAYPRGIYPWYSDGEPVLWWSPDPRMVLHCNEFKASRSLRKTLRAAADSDAVQVHLNRDFERVVRACAAPRSGQDGTWITEAIVSAYGELHRRGLAHSMEVWQGDDLVGGLYGVSIGRMFYGESMFHKRPDASKIALAALVRLLVAEEVPVIDCQQKTSHLASLGAREIPRRDFCRHVAGAVERPPVDWISHSAGPLNGLLSVF